MIKEIRLKDVFPAWVIGDGIFGLLSAFNVPWAESISATPLDISYIGGHSGEKLVSPLVKNLLTDGSLTTAARTLLANSLFSIYGENWVKQWDTLNFVYDPIENYNMTEEMRGDETIHSYGKTTQRTDNLSESTSDSENVSVTGRDERTDNLAHSKMETDTLTHNTTDTRTPNTSKVTENDTFGFNSLTAVPTDKTTETETGTETNAKTGTESTQIIDSETHTGTQVFAKTEGKMGTNTGSRTNTGTQSYSDSGRDVDTRNYTLSRSGNIGVTTSQQMISQERELWMWNYFNNVVFPDIDAFLCLSVY